VITSKNGCTQKSYYIRPPAAVQTVPGNDEGNSLILYPNPVDQVLNLRLLGKLQDLVDIRIFDLMGREVLLAPMTGNKTRVDVNSLAPGTYVVACYVNGAKITGGNFIKN
jgi:hypothetical protein